MSELQFRWSPSLVLLPSAVVGLAVTVSAQRVALLSGLSATHCRIRWHLSPLQERFGEAVADGVEFVSAPATYRYTQSAYSLIRWTVPVVRASALPQPPACSSLRWHVGASARWRDSCLRTFCQGVRHRTERNVMWARPSLTMCCCPEIRSCRS